MCPADGRRVFSLLQNKGNKGKHLWEGHLFPICTKALCEQGGWLCRFIPSVFRGGEGEARGGRDLRNLGGHSLDSKFLDGEDKSHIQTQLCAHACSSVCTQVHMDTGTNTQHTHKHMVAHVQIRHTQVHTQLLEEAHTSLRCRGLLDLSQGHISL